MVEIKTNFCQIHYRFVFRTGQACPKYEALVSSALRLLEMPPIIAEIAFRRKHFYLPRFLR